MRRFFFECFVVGGIDSGCFDTARLVVGSVPTEMPSSVTSRRRCVFTRAYGRAAEEPLIRCCVSSSKNPFRPQCGPRAAHTQNSSELPRRLRRFPFVFLPLTYTPAHAQALTQVIYAPTALSHSPSITPWCRNGRLYVPTCKCRYASSLQENDERGKTKTAYKSACALKYIIITLLQLSSADRRPSVASAHRAHLNTRVLW